MGLLALAEDGEYGGSIESCGKSYLLYDPEICQRCRHSGDVLIEIWARGKTLLLLRQKVKLGTIKLAASRKSVYARYRF